ncbi:endonuclease [Candidatus Giovannonibacteria bacterium RIFCSPLOWO2_01_FULL_44_16]|uniref:Endonuclease n=1 Tax=Candidatus Giovannonibacteria bacterium RIFCSPLOWO2_01_FULL_44_16 TaxID=1798348 RepID=A0A1F5X2P1_9BACT|nr:MAG: endonuclease [Candidatus Giovannonibacteria bacterium RIFCSPLOWO2_01_FULL_44_16]
MYHVYAIQSFIDGRIYVGMTQNVNQRTKEHNDGRVFSTKGYRPWKLIYTETQSTRPQARVREKQLKSGYGKEFLKSIL